jgi:hypothetical protein
VIPTILRPHLRPLKKKMRNLIELSEIAMDTRLTRS